MRGPEGHVGLGVEHRHDVGVVVLAAQADQHAGVVLRDQHLLQGAPRRVEDDPERPVLPRDAGPQGVIAVGDDDLGRRADQRVEAARHQRPQGRELRGRVGDVPDVVAVRVVVVRDGIERGQRRRGDHGHPIDAGELGGDRVLGEPVARAPLRREDRRRRRAETEEVGRAGRARRRPEGAGQIGRRAPAGLVPVLEADQHHVEPAAVLRERPLRVEELLKDLIVRRYHGVDGQGQLVPPELDHLEDGLGGEGGGDGDRASGHLRGPEPVEAARELTESGIELYPARHAASIAARRCGTTPTGRDVRRRTGPWRCGVRLLTSVDARLASISVCRAARGHRRDVERLRGGAAASRRPATGGHTRRRACAGVRLRPALAAGSGRRRAAVTGDSGAAPAATAKARQPAPPARQPPAHPRVTRRRRDRARGAQGDRQRVSVTNTVVR